MSEHTALTTTSRDLATVAPLVNWQAALETFLNTLSSPRTQKAYERAVTEAMKVMGADLVADLTPPMLAEYRAGLVARLDADRYGCGSNSAFSLTSKKLLPRQDKSCRHTWASS